jgi:hypothetical protein
MGTPLESVGDSPADFFLYLRYRKLRACDLLELTISVRYPLLKIENLLRELGFRHHH